MILKRTQNDDVSRDVHKYATPPISSVSSLQKAYNMYGYTDVA